MPVLSGLPYVPGMGGRDPEFIIMAEKPSFSVSPTSWSSLMSGAQCVRVGEWLCEHWLGPDQLSGSRTTQASSLCLMPHSGRGHIS